MVLFFGDKNKKQAELSQVDRRHYPRFYRNYILKYFSLEKPEEKIETTQLKNMSQGGMCFVTTQSFEKGTQIGVELETPYLSDVTYLEAIVLESHQKVADLIYETRVAFKRLSPDAEFLVGKLMEFLLAEDKKEHKES